MDYQADHTQESIAPAGRTGHSGLGISSFVIATLFAITLLGLFVVAAIVETNSPSGMDEESTEAVLIGLVLIGSFLAELFAVAFGIAGLIQRTKGRLFAILGLSISSVIILLTATLIVIGLAAG